MTEVEYLSRIIIDYQNKIRRVRELHKPVKTEGDSGIIDICKDCSDAHYICDGVAYVEYPCPTIKALDGDSHEKE